MPPDSPQDNTRDTGPRARLAELPERLLALVRASPAGELEHHVKALLAQTIDKLDLVTREEFDIQRDMVERLRTRLERLEAAQQESKD